MTTTTSRVLQLLELLQSADTRTVAELAERLAVNERTVRRYVQHLLDLEIPVESVRGRYGGYRIRAGYRMPPVILSDDEAVALLLGLVHAQASSDAPDVAIQTAMSKIRRSLPAESARRLDSLLETAVLDVPTQRDVPDAGTLLTIADAIKQRRPLDLRYLDAADTPSRRTVLPHDLVAHSGRWYLIAFDTARRSERTFRVDRIRTARAASGTFEPSGRVALPEPIVRTVSQPISAMKAFAWSPCNALAEASSPSSLAAISSRTHTRSKASSVSASTQTS